MGILGKLFKKKGKKETLMIQIKMRYMYNNVSGEIWVAADTIADGRIKAQKLLERKYRGVDSEYPLYCNYKIDPIEVRVQSRMNEN